MSNTTALIAKIFNTTTLKVKMIWFLGGLLVAFSGYGLYLLQGRSNNAGDMKLSSLRPSRDIVVHTYKLLPPFQVEITKVSPDDIAPDTTFTLEARIRVERDLSQLRYSWILPKGVQLYGSSPTSGRLDHLNPHQAHILTARFYNLSPTNEKVFLRIETGDTRNSERLTVPYNTMDEERLKAAQAELDLRNSEYLADHPEALEHRQ